MHVSATPQAGFACPDLTVFCRLDELGLTATEFSNLTNYIARSLLETGGFRLQLLHRGM